MPDAGRAVETLPYPAALEHRSTATSNGEWQGNQRTNTMIEKVIAGIGGLVVRSRQSGRLAGCCALP